VYAEVGGAWVVCERRGFVSTSSSFLSICVRRCDAAKVEVVVVVRIALFCGGSGVKHVK
jgi:hypothetical protein